MAFIILFFLFVFTLGPSLSLAQDNFLLQAQIGRYILIGKGINSDKTYIGKVEIAAEGEALSITRTIDGHTVKGVGAIETTLNGDSKVLRIEFSQDGEVFEETCIFMGDLNNYSRISCYLYQPSSPTSDPGLEAMFHDHRAHQAN